MLATGALGLAVMLGGCQATDAALTTPADSGRFAGGLFGAPWGGMRPAEIGDSLTAARVRGAEALAEPLQPEPGNVWPAEEAPRATLANPDAALRGIPTYRPSGPRALDDLSGEPLPGGREPLASRGAPNRLRGSSSPPPPPLVEPELPEARLPPPTLPPLPEPPPRRVEGQTVLTPQYGPVVTGSGTDRVQSFITPGGGTGVITRDGPNSIITGPDGRVQVLPNPR